jgi:23S rRNA (pseudouridine1915-N3)-methyltransferase
MRIRLVSVGTRPPRWVREGYAEYARRMPRECRLELVEVPPQKGEAARKAREGRRLLEKVGAGDLVVALDPGGTLWSTEQLARRLERWMQEGRDLSLLIGGADGLACDCLERASVHWSLSPLTFPHMLVRILVAEQIYRACGWLRGHPYHRA